MRRGEKRSEPRETAKDILAVVNLLPPGIQLPDSNGIYLRLCHEYPGGLEARINKSIEYFNITAAGGKLEVKERFEFIRVFGAYFLQALTLALEGLPDPFIEYINLPESDFKRFYPALGNRLSIFQYDDADPTDLNHNAKLGESFGFDSKFDLAYERYELARSWYMRLYALADFLHTPVEKSRPLNRFDASRPILRINKVVVVNGRIDIEPDLFTDAFVGIPIERIALCKKCGRVFWVKRKDMVGCSVPCAKVLRTRKWREKITAEQRLKYKYNRIKKEMKKGE